MKKRNLMLQSAVASALLVMSAGAYATVDMNASPVVPVKFASEIVATTAAPVPLTNAATGLNLQVAQGYAMSEGEVRYARMECSSNMKFDAASAVTSSNGATLIGAINGLGTNVIYFSVTAGVGGGLAADTLTVDGTRTVSSTGDVSCSYSLYDQPSQAQAGGATGRIVSVADKAYIDFTAALLTTVTPATSTADVEATTGAYTKFTTGNTYTELADVVITDANASAIDGTTLLDTELLSNTDVSVAGDFTAAANTDGTYTGAALGRVWIDGAADCSTGSDDVGDFLATTLSATAATFTGPTANIAGTYSLCFASNGTAAIPAATYTATVDYTTIGAAYAVTDVTAAAAGTIVRNGTTMVAPLVQKPAGWLSRLVLVNKGTAARAYTVSAVAESGNTVTLSGAAASGTLGAGQTTVVDLPDLIAATGSPRTSLVVTVNGPENQISGLYQIVNATTGSISNHVLDYKQ